MSNDIVQDGDWHKVLAAVVAKSHGRDLRLDLEDFVRVDGSVVVVNYEGVEGMVMRVRVVTPAEAARIEAAHREDRL